MTKIASPTKENTVRFSAVSVAEQRRRIDQVIARRAYEIFEGRGGGEWHELEDWRQAESEVRCRLCFGLTTSIDSVLVGCDGGSFEKGTIELWVAPRQITVCGKPLRPNVSTSGPTRVYQGMVFRVIVLPAVIDTKGVFARWKSSFLELHLPIVKALPQLRAQAV
jgi:hypothetical protein